MTTNEEKNTVSMSISMSREDKKLLKQLALDRDIPVSKLIVSLLHAELETCDKK